MKMINAFLFVLLSAITADAQSSETPKKEFLLVPQSKSLEVNRGSTGTIHLQIVKSKSFLRATPSFGLASALPEGVTIQYDEQVDKDSYAAVIAASAQAPPGVYNVVLNCTLLQKTKGVILKLTIL